jgi:hypothetical protein
MESGLGVIALDAAGSASLAMEGPLDSLRATARFKIGG